MEVPPESNVFGWQDMIDYMDRTWATKKGVKHYPWKGRDFKTLAGLANNFGAAGVMALWDLYLEGNSYWGLKTGLMFDGLIYDVGLLLDNKRYKHILAGHEKKIDKNAGLHDAKAILDNVPIGKLKVIGGDNA